MALREVAICSDSEVFITEQEIGTLTGEGLHGEAETCHRTTGFGGFFKQCKAAHRIFFYTFSLDIEICRAEDTVYLSNILAPLVFHEGGFEVFFNVFLVVADGEISTIFLGRDGFFEPLAAFFLIAVFFIAAEQTRTESCHGAGIA